MSNDRGCYDLLAYAKTLARGGAGNNMVRRLGQYVDYDVETLTLAVRYSEGRQHGSCVTGRCDPWSGPPCSGCKGVHHALTMALGDAEDRAYQRRHGRR